MKTNETMKTQFKPGPLPVRLQPWISEDGTPFIAYATSNQQPQGIKIVGNGTLTHPLDVELSGVYAAAPAMLDALQHCLMIEEAREHPAVSALVRAAIAKATDQ